LSLIAWYKLDGNTLDSSGNNLNMTSQSNISWGNGKIGQCGVFNPASISRESSAFRNPLFTISTWIKTSKTTRQGIISITFGLILETNSGGILRVRIDSGTSITTYSSDVFVADDLFHHLACSYDGNVTKMFVDGVHVSTHTAPFNNRYSNNVLIGNDVNSTSGGSDFIGLIDDMRIYDQPLSDKEIRELYKTKILHYKFDYDLDLLDSSEYRNHSSISASPVWSINSVIGSGCYTFPSASDVVLSPPCNQIIGNSPYQITVSLWVKTSSSSGSYSLMLPQSSGNSTLLSITSNQGVAGAISVGSLGFLTRNRGDTTHSWLTYNGGYNDGNWHHVVAVINDMDRKLFIDGIERGSDNSVGMRLVTDVHTNNIRVGHDLVCSVDDLRIYLTSLSSADALELYQTRASLDSHGNFHTNQLVETKHRPLIVDYTTWSIGTSGSQTGFNINGSVSENFIIDSLDPWGKSVAIWEARPDATSNADGGWNGSIFSIDNTKLYRYSVWVNRKILGNGSFYLGLYGYNSSNTNIGVINVATGSNSTNPYFWSGSIPQDQWLLFVGHVFPFGHTGTTRHPDSGRYNVNGFVSNTSADYKWNSTGAKALHRSYLYYSTDTNTRQQWCYPRVDIVDGNEPSIQDLLNGFDSRNFDYINSIGGKTIQPLSVKDKYTITNNISEVGITDGLIAWYPLDGNANDVSGNGNHGTVSGATITNGIKNQCYSFDGVDDYVDCGNITLSGNFTWECYFKTLDTSLRLMDIRGTGSLGVVKGVQISYVSSWSNALIDDGLGNYIQFSGASSFGIDNEWHKVSITFDNTTGTGKFYGDGVLLDTQTNSSLIGITFIDQNLILGANVNGKNTQLFSGKIDDVRIYNRSLSPEEIKLQYDLTINTKMKLINSNNVYIAGSIKEV
jgi:hypothetical protein